MSKIFPPGVPLWKRLFDLVVTLIGLVVALPLMLIIALIVWISEGAPVVFSQRRPGLHGKIFTLHKFRTMRNAVDAQGTPLPDGQRITPLGKFLRASSLDELPELFNVLRGEMSLVGPRPLLIEYLPLYNAEQARRHEVLPGLTGWAQINGRNALSWQDRFRLDVWYVDHVSFWLDIKILALSVLKVVRREGINMPGQATTEYFSGNPPED
jgi:lipopolysaccharide/colanic/teichoic acid biosynthesis glycosyltransferase